MASIETLASPGPAASAAGAAEASSTGTAAAAPADGPGLRVKVTGAFESCFARARVPLRLGFDTTSLTRTSRAASLFPRTAAARFVATWRWAVADVDDVCGICRLAFESCCPTCKLPGDDCPPMVGGCKHAFHLHCIMTWLAAKDKEQVCPLCRREWDVGVQ
jgi:anaphase-promoting complex subunit 11